jgi:hypothetical protein
VVSNNITPTTATLNWDAMPNATAYEVNYRPMNAPATQPWNTVTTPTNTVTINALTPSTMYDVQIRSVCGADFSDYTATTSFSTQNCLPPMNPSVSNLTANTADVQWTAVPGASGYQLLYRIAVSDGTPDPWTTVSLVNNAYNLTGLASNTLYAGRLITDCGGFLSDTSKVFYFSTNPCSVPNNLIITAQTASSISLAWDAVPSANQYNVQYRTAGNGTWSTVNTNTNSRTINGLTGNTAYEFRVRSNCGGGVTSAYTLIIKGFTLPCAMPENAVISNVMVNSATVSWNNAVGANQYRVEYREALSPAWTTVNANSTTKTINNLTPDTDYEVRVRSRCSGNQYSAYTDTLKFRTKKCGVPSQLRVTNLTVRGGTVHWSSAENATAYRLAYRAVGDTGWVTVNVNDTFKILNNLSQGILYEVKVSSRCANQIFSDYSEVTYLIANTCVTPIGFEVGSVTASSAQLSWDSTSYVVNYRLEYKSVHDSLWTLRTVLPGQTTVLLNNLIPQTEYWARITTHCGNGVFSPVWDTLRFQTEECMMPQFIYADTVTYQSITVVWDDVPNVNYSVEHRPVNSNVWTVRNTNQNRLRYTQLQAGTGYWFRLRSRCGPNGWSAYSNELLLQTQKCKNPILYTPDTLSPTSLRLKWSSDPNDRYLLRYKRQSDSTWQSRNVNDTTFVLQNIVLSDNYEYLLQKRCTNELLSDAAALSIGNPPNPCNQARLDVRCGKLVLDYGTSTVDPFLENCSLLVRVRKEISNQTVSRTLVLSDFDVHSGTKRYTTKLRLDQLFINIDEEYSYDVCISFPACGNRQPCGPVCEYFNLAPDSTQLRLRAESNTPGPICSGSAVRLIAELRSANFKSVIYWWQGGGLDRRTREPHITVNPQATTTYTVSVYDEFNPACVYTATVTVNVSPRPVINLSCPTILCRSDQPYTLNVSWTPAVNPNDVRLIGTTAWSLTNDGSSGTLSFTPRTAGVYPFTLSVTLGNCESTVSCSVTVIDADFRMPELRPCYQAGETVNLTFTYPPNDNFNVSLVTWRWFGPNGSIGTKAGTYEGLTITVPAISQTTTYTVQMQVGNTACISERVIPLNLCGECQDDCTIQITPRPEPCYSARVELCAPTYREGTIYTWRYIRPESAIFATTRCITIDVPFEPGNRMIEVTANVPGANGLPNQIIVSALPVNQLVYPRGVNPVPFNVNTASALLNQLNSTELIDPQAFNGVGYPNNVQGTLFFPTLNNNNFTVDRNLTLRNMRIVMGGGIRIVVPAGVTLTMDNCYIHSINGETTPWSGILVGSGSEVANPGRVIFNRVTMEHSLEGITNIDRRINNPQDQGSPGLVWVDHSCLNENRRHIDLEYSRSLGTLWESTARVIRTIPTPLVLRNTVMTCIDPLPGTGNNYTDQALRLRNIIAAQVGANVASNQTLQQVQPQLLPPPAPRSAFPTVFNSAGWLNPNRITRADVGIQLARDVAIAVNLDTSPIDVYYINNNVIGNLIDQQSNVVKSVGIDVRPLLNAQGRQVNNKALEVNVGTLLNGYRINAPNDPNNRPSNDFAIDPTVFQPTTPLPPVPTRMDYAIRTSGNLGLFSSIENRFVDNSLLNVRNCRFRNIGVQSGVEAVAGIHSRYPRYTTWDIQNNRFEDIEYGTWVAEQVASAGFNNRYTVNNNYFFRFKCGAVFYSNDIYSPFVAPNTTIRGRVTVNKNTFEEYVNNRQDNARANQPHLAPVGWHDGGIVALGPQRPANHVPIPSQPDFTIEDNRFIGNQQSAMIILGESPVSNGSIRRNIVAPNSNGYTNRTCKIGIQNVVSVRLNIEDNDIDLGNTDPTNMINNVPGIYGAQGGGSGQNENPNSALYSSAFWMSQTQGPQSIACNRVKNGAYGFDVRGDCVPGVQFKGNLMNNLNVGVMFRKETGYQGQLGVQGTLSPPASHYNVWNILNPNSTQFHTYTWDSDGNLTTFIVSTNDGQVQPPYTQNQLIHSSNGSNIVNFQPLLITDYVYGCGRRFPNKSDYFNYKQTPDDVSYPTEERIARGVDQDPNLKYDQHQKLMTFLSETGNQAVYQSAVLDSFFRANQHTAMAGFITVERLLDAKPEAAHRLNESLVPTNQKERNQQTYYRLYLSAARKEGKLSTEEYLELVKVAKQCPDTGGKAVMQSRLMRFNLDLLWHEYPECGNKTEKPIVNKSAEVPQSLSLYPNPATISVNVQYDLNEESAKVIFYNVMGTAVHRQDLAGKKGTIAIETRNWPSGVYTAKIIGRNGENFGVSKLVIVK